MRQGTSFRSIQALRTELSRGQIGPMSSLVEDLADEIYQSDDLPDTDIIWDLPLEEE